MWENQKHSFWQALIITLFVFGFGVLIGIFIENSRAGVISDIYTQSEINLLDVDIQSQLLDLEWTNCETAVKQNIDYANQIYEDAKILENYGEASRISDSIIAQHKKYDLLRTLLWINSIKIKQNCDKSFSTIVYIYNYNPSNVNEISEQEIFSRFLGELKSEKGNTIILIPIAKNLGLNSVNSILEKYNITKTAVIINEEIVIDSIDDLEKIQSYLN